jgi:hypothetical protein
MHRVHRIPRSTFVTTRPPLFMSTGRRQTITYFRKTEAKYFSREGLTGESISHRVAHIGVSAHRIFVVREPIRGFAAPKIAQPTTERANQRSISGAGSPPLAGRGCMSLMYRFAPGAFIRPASGGSAFRAHCRCSLLLGMGLVTTEVKLCTNRKASRSTGSTFP